MLNWDQDNSRMRAAHLQGVEASSIQEDREAHKVTVLSYDL